MPEYNPNCDGDWCENADGETRLYPLGGGANLILCKSCWEHENTYRREQGLKYRRPEDWPERNWENGTLVYEGGKTVQSAQ